MKILMVDDNNFSLKIAKNTLEEGKVNCEIFGCNDGWKALELLHTEKVDIIILDIIMPEISGIELLKKIRGNSDYKDIQIIMLTATTDHFTLKECFDSGANDFIRKPIEPIEFIARVNAAIRVRQYIKQMNKALNVTMKQNQELKQMTKKLNEAQFFLVQKEKMAAIGELAAGVAHEINNPMGFISSNFETLSKYIDKFKLLIEKYREMLSEKEKEKSLYESLAVKWKTIHELEKSYHLEFMMNDIGDLIKDTAEGIDRVTKIVQSLRRFARTGIENEFSYCDISEIIKEAIMITKNEAKYTTDVEIDLAELQPIHCNRGQIGQVIMNMIVNGVQAIKSKKRNQRGHIWIKTYLENQWLVVKISDDGPGIKEEVIGEIFNPFFTTKDVGEGTGLGLSICYDIIVNKHKGELTVDTKENNGTDFFIKLPV